jgi:hypothetical protein
MSKKRNLPKEFTYRINGYTLSLIAAGETTRTEDTPCPFCLTIVSAATGLNDPLALPYPGAWTVCSTCGGICVFDTNLRLRKPTEEELTELKRFPDVWATVEEYSKKMRDASFVVGIGIPPPTRKVQ